MENKTTEFLGKKVHYTIEGQGDTLVFIHGFMESCKIWEKFSAKLSSQFKVICIDLPGHGETECFGEVHPISMQADLVADVLAKENVKTCVLTGHSMGGYVCLSFVDRYPHLSSGLGLFHSQAAPDSEHTTAFRNRTIDLLNRDRVDFIHRFIPDLFAEGNAEKFPEQIRQLTEDAKKMDVKSIIASQIGMRDRGSFLDVLVNAKIPILFIQGKQDTKSNLSKVIAQTLLPSRAEVLIIEAGHMGYIEQFENTLSFVRGFAQRAYHQY